jgi:hypothetical protein
LFPDVALMEYEPVWALLLTIPALPEVLHDPVVSNPEFCTSGSVVANEAGTHDNTQINAAKYFILFMGLTNFPSDAEISSPYPWRAGAGKTKGQRP